MHILKKKKADSAKGADDLRPSLGRNAWFGKPLLAIIERLS